MAIPRQIVCVDCGGICHLLSASPPDQGFAAGDVVAYRCSDCLDRWDVVLAEEDLSAVSEDPPTRPARPRRRAR